MTLLKTLKSTALILAVAGSLTPPAYANHPGCDDKPTTVGWIACRARETRDARLCTSIADTTLKHFCTESAGEGGCEDIRDPEMAHLCSIHAEIR